MWTCLYFHTLPLQIFALGQEQPFAVSDSDKVFLCNERARASGIKPGMKLAAAHALDSRLNTVVRDPKKETAVLESLALTAMQFSSVVSLTPPFALLLETGGSLSLFGGFHRFLEKLQNTLRESSLDFAIASSPTALGAGILARAGLDLHVAEIEQLKQQLFSLPIGFLEYASDALQALADIGMRTIGDVLTLPRDELARRFGQELLDMLDRALGDAPDARPLFVPPANYASKLELPAPVYDAEALLFATKRLIGELAGFLSARSAGALELNLDLCHEDGSVTRVPFTFSLATRDSAHLTSIFRERLFNLSLPSRVEAIALEACKITPLGSRNLSLLVSRDQEKENRAQLTERLRARLGADAVVTLQPVPDHRPELAWRYGKDEDEGGRRKEEVFHPSSLIPHPSHHSSPFILHSSNAPRPLWLLNPPLALEQETIIEQLHIFYPLGEEGQGEGEWSLSPSLRSPFRQGRAAKPSLTLLSGPERIESGWWDGNDVARDYFVACDDKGARFWVFKQEQWFLHGIFA
jgi:protein ImuB